MNNYDKRWNHAFTWAKKLKDLFDTGDYFLVDSEGGNYFPGTTKIKINESARTIDFVEDNFTYMIYDGDLDWDHGSYTPIKEFKKQVIDTFSLYKKELIKF